MEPLVAQQSSSDPLLVVVGPTASGKSLLAMRLAERLRGEIVSADSAQVYRRVDIGTGKPTASERRRVPHHLIDICDPLDAMDAARWAGLADGAISEIRQRSAVPIVCGGTFLWVKALLRGLAPAPPGDAMVRDRHRAIAEERGRPALHALLSAVDPPAARRLSPNDFVRVSRALEVHELTGTTLTDWHAAHGFRTARHSARLIAIRRDPEELTQRIETRVTSMLAAGWVDEVRALIADGLGSSRALGSVGYRQVVDALRTGEVDEATLREKIVRATRVFARRQRTWLRDEPVQWLSPDEAERFVL